MLFAGWGHGPRLMVYALGVALVMLLMTGRAARLIAQEEGAAGEPAAAAAPADADAQPVDQANENANADGAQPDKGTWGTALFQWPQSVADWVAWGFYGVLLIFSMVAVTVSLERLVRLTRQRVLPAEFVRKLNELVRTGNDNQRNFRTLAEGGNSIVALVLRAGLVRAGRPLLEVEKGMEDALAREISALRGRHRALSVLGNVAPLVGLFGTVVGIMFAFDVVSQAGLGKAELMASGINVALRTTAAGLTIAVPCLLLVAWFNARIDRFMRDIDETLLQTLPGFARMEQTGAASPAASANGDGAAQEEERRVPISAK